MLTISKILHEQHARKFTQVPEESLSKAQAPEGGRRKSQAPRKSLRKLLKPPTIQLRLPGTYPAYEKGHAGDIPINEQGQRLDFAMKFPPKHAREAFHTRTGKALCISHHLTGVCSKGDTCRYDHSELDSSTFRVFRYMTKTTPCSHGSECQRVDCVYGHVCQDTRCLEELREKCPLAAFHGVNPQVAAWTKVEVEDDGVVDNSEEVTPEGPEGDFWF